MTIKKWNKPNNKPNNLMMNIKQINKKDKKTNYEINKFKLKILKYQKIKNK
jgi:hypothetical protein